MGPQIFLVEASLTEELGTNTIVDVVGRLAGEPYMDEVSVVLPTWLDPRLSSAVRSGEDGLRGEACSKDDFPLNLGKFPVRTGANVLFCEAAFLAGVP